MFKHKPIHKTRLTLTLPKLIISHQNWDEGSSDDDSCPYEACDYNYFSPPSLDNSIEELVQSLSPYGHHSMHTPLQEVEDEDDLLEDAEHLPELQKHSELFQHEEDPLQRLNAQYLNRMSSQEKESLRCVRFGEAVFLKRFSDDDPVVAVSVAKQFEAPFDSYQQWEQNSQKDSLEKHTKNNSIYKCFDQNSI